MNFGVENIILIKTQHSFKFYLITRWARERRRIAPLLSKFTVTSRKVDYFLYICVVICFSHKVLNVAFSIDSSL